MKVRYHQPLQRLQDRPHHRGQALFGLSALIWLFVLLPVQAAQSRLARRFVADGEIPAAYWKLCRRWLGWGALATVPLVIIVCLMALKI